MTRLVVAPLAGAPASCAGLDPRGRAGASGVFARFSKDGRSLDLLDESGDVARTVHAGRRHRAVVAGCARAPTSSSGS